MPVHYFDCKYVFPVILTFSLTCLLLLIWEQKLSGSKPGILKHRGQTGLALLFPLYLRHLGNVRFKVGLPSRAALYQEGNHPRVCVKLLVEIKKKPRKYFVT